MKISTRLLLLFLLVGVLPLALFSYFNLQGDEETLRNEALGRMSALADKKAIQVKSYLAEQVKDVRFLARSPWVQGAIGIMPREYASGRLKAAGYAREDALTRQYFDDYVEESRVFYDVFLITPQGEVVYSQKHEADFATNLLDGPWHSSQLAQAFRDARMMLEPVISGYEYYAPSSAPALFIAAPIMVDGKFKGVFAVQLGNELFYKVATDATGLGLSGEAAFAQRDGDGLLVTTPLKHSPDAALKLRLNRQESQRVPMMKALSGEAGADVTVDYRSKQEVAAWRYLPELNWGVVVKMDGDEVFASIYQQRIVMLGTVLGLLLVTGMVAYFFGRKISIPLKDLSRTADEVAKGNLDKRADESAPGELGLLARSFNRMAENLQALYGSLENRIKERTEKLTQSMVALRVAAVAFETHEGIMITDAQANILRVNRAFQEITGYDADEVIGKNPRILNSGRQDKAFYTAMWGQLLEEGAWSGEIYGRRKNGEIYPKWMTISAVKDEQGNVTEYAAIFSDITARKQAEEEIRNLAFYDALTGLPNRRLLRDRSQLALSMSARNHLCGALLFLDMDKFKTLNDTLGHDHGDLMLVEVARRIKACVREVDTVSRLGGDEFVVLIEEIGANLQEASQKVASIAEKIRTALTDPYELNGHEYHGSTSIGVCMYRGNSESMDVLMKHADMAMYQAKDSGRNAVRFFDPVMQHAVEAHLELETDLRSALLNRQMQLYYQIQVDGDHRPIGAEALIRWMHPKRGMVSPAQFIPIAEESSLILDIGYWVIETACQLLAEWEQHEQTRYLILAINVSAHQFRMADFVERLEEAITRYGIVPNRLKLELTESVVLGDVADVVGKMHALKALGVRLSLDDFGTGYSSLSYLKQLPIDQVKIDQSFVRDIITDPNTAVMVKTIIDMADNFRLNVIAEGVETEAQLAFLKQHGCMAYQGYLFSKPVPLEEFEALLGGM